ncbi:MAG: hypothetical protein JXA92_00700 [candidate division Zixibacteria bacterium]|nr:hypothetical protein [candidate division Zixibacteria bacterium]
MTEKQLNIKNLVKLHTSLWYFLILWFALAALWYLLETETAEIFSYTGIVLTIALTILRLAVLSEQFRRLARLRFQLIGYLLILIILVTIMIKYLTL